MTRGTLCLAVAGAAVLVGCGGGDGIVGPGGESDPVLSVPMVDLTTIRDFIPFGAALPGSGVINPAYEMVLEGTDLEIRAVTAGTVVTIAANDAAQGDYELHVRPTGSPSYLVIYDHVLDVSVHVGDVVQPGGRLGRIGNWTPTEGRVELQINHGDLAVCPRGLGTAEFNAAHDAALAAVAGEGASVCLTDIVQP
jgi:hypothetical protein